MWYIISTGSHLSKRKTMAENSSKAETNLTHLLGRRVSEILRPLNFWCTPRDHPTLRRGRSLMCTIRSMYSNTFVSRLMFTPSLRTRLFSVISLLRLLSRLLLPHQGKTCSLFKYTYMYRPPPSQSPVLGVLQLKGPICIGPHLLSLRYWGFYSSKLKPDGIRLSPRATGLLSETPGKILQLPYLFIMHLFIFLMALWSNKTKQ